MRAVLAALALMAGSASTIEAPAASIPPRLAEPVAINRNENPAGTLRNGALTVRLEIRAGEWQPDADRTTGVNVYALGEEGRALQVPGPLIRVTQGTVIHATIRNRVGEKLYLRGLYDRSSENGSADPLEIEPGAMREVQFTANTPGTFYYWGSATPSPDLLRPGTTSQLSGAFVVDPRGAARVRDRIIVLGLWAEQPVGLLTGNEVVRFVMNGLSWPKTETLHYTAGDSIHWRLINVTSAVHPMHLHGFYFQVRSRGTLAADTIYGPAEAPRMVVTERLAPGNSMTMSWTAERPGNWLFHCHDNPHIAKNRPLPGAPAVKARDSHAVNHSQEFMGGLVMGVEVKPRGGSAAAAQPDRRRELRLIARADTDGTAAEPSYGFVLEDGARIANPTAAVPGPTILLKKGEPVRIMVVNELPEATAIHWHGIELDSYYDGVADFAGSSRRIAPAIQPRDSFEVLFTPPRSGTFIYHTHVDELRQQRAGLSGPLLVVDAPERHDPATDLTLMLSVPRRTADNAVILVNGTATPAPLQLQTGTSYRLRIVNIHTFRPSMRVELKQGTDFLTWRPVAKDGADLPAERATARRSAIQMGNGETYDFEFSPAAPGELRIEVVTAVGVLLATVPIHVR